MRKPIILYVEDNPDDDFFLRRSLQVASVPCEVRSVSNVQAARSYFKGDAPFNDRQQFPLPDLVITDISVPTAGESSIGLVQWLRSQPQFHALKILCLTGSDDPSPRAALAALAVECFTKTARPSDLLTAIKEAIAAL